MFDGLKSLIRRKRDHEELTVLSLFRTFRELLDSNNLALDLMADMGEKLGGDYLFDKNYIEKVIDELQGVVYRIVYDLNLMTQKKYLALFDVFEKAKMEIQAELDSRFTVPKGEYVYDLADLTKEMSDYVGEKMATLGELRNRLGLEIPQGFVISTYAYKKFIEYNALEDFVLPVCEGGFSGEAMEAKARELRERILKARIPPEVEKSIRTIRSSQLGVPADSWAVRSSSLGEDTRISYAGQYATVLNVPFRQIGSAYKKVLASLFSPQVIAYRKGKRIAQKEMAMAVGCMPMVSANVSGVTFTADPVRPEEGQMIISAAWGLGKLVVEGEGEVDQYRVSKILPHSILRRHVGDKEKRYVANDAEGVSLIPVSPEKRRQPCLDEPVLRRIVEDSVRIEQFMKSSQDIEWSIDEQGRIVYLQARPLQFSAGQGPDKRKLVAAARNYPVLLKDAGVIASRGIGAGVVVQVQAEEENPDFPRGSVLVLKHTSPRLSKLVPLASAVVTDIGAITGHMATVCREFRVPTIVDTQHATQRLKPGMEVTVDAEENVIYQGIVKELLTVQLIEKTPYEETYEFKLLRRLLRKVSILNVTDPESRYFHPAHCKTFHDIIRFAHETAVRKIAEGVRPSKLGSTQPVAKLNLPIPLNLTVVDIGGGIKNGSVSPEISMGEIACLPLSILLNALTAPGVWQSEPVDLDLKGFMSSFTSGHAAQTLSSNRPSVNLAIVSEGYLNLSLNLGYHFNMIDANISDDRNGNYIYFRFFGGVTEFTRRSRRVRVLARILERNDFAVESKGDLLIARIKKISRDAMEDKLRLMGKLIGYTRQLDVLLRREKDIELFTDQFISGMRSIEAT